MTFITPDTIAMIIAAAIILFIPILTSAIVFHIAFPQTVSALDAYVALWLVGKESK